MAPELHGLAMAVYDLWAADYGREPPALTLQRWAESTVFTWARELRLVGRAGLLDAECFRAEALARHLVHLAAAGKPPAALRGTISAVRMAEKLQLCGPQLAQSTGLSPPGLAGPTTQSRTIAVGILHHAAHHVCRSAIGDRLCSAGAGCLQYMPLLASTPEASNTEEPLLQKKQFPKDDDGNDYKRSNVYLRLGTGRRGRELSVVHMRFCPRFALRHVLWSIHDACPALVCKAVSHCKFCCLEEQLVAGPLQNCHIQRMQGLVPFCR